MACEGKRRMKGILAGWGMGLSLGLMVAGMLTGSAQTETPVPPALPSDAIVETVNITVPPSVKQGEVLRVTLQGVPETFHNGMVLMADRKAPIFKQADGTFLALLPVSVFQKPGGYTLTVKDAGGVTQKQAKVQVYDGRYSVQNIRVSATTGGLKPLPGELEAIQALKDTVTPIRHWSEPFITPTPDCQNSPFGNKRAHNGKLTGDYHKGVDLRSPAGRPIRATNGGRVQIATMYRLHGGTVGIDHGQGIGSIYIHMSKIAVKPGDIVQKGDVIGYVGSTGFATGPHLHWGMYVNGLPVNPNQWIKGVPRC